MVLLVRGNGVEDEAGEIGRREYVRVACEERSQCWHFGALDCGGYSERHEVLDLLGAEIDGL